MDPPELHSSSTAPPSRAPKEGTGVHLGTFVKVSVVSIVSRYIKIRIFLTYKLAYDACESILCSSLFFTYSVLEITPCQRVGDDYGRCGVLSM